MALPKQLPWYDIGNPAIQRLSPEEIRALQLERLQNMVEYVYYSSPFWRRKLEDAKVTPEQIKTLDDVRRLPFTTRDELLADQEEHPPFGSYVCSHPSTWCRVFATSGTTGRPLKRVLSFRDWELSVRAGLRYGRFPAYERAITDREVVVFLHRMDGLWAITAGMEAAIRRGALVVPLGRYTSEQKVQLIHELRATTVHGTPSYLLYLGRLAEQMGMPMHELGSIRVLSMGYEPGAAVEATRERVRELWGQVEIRDGYGLTEICGLGGNCSYSSAIHLPADLVLVEVIDPQTGEPAPLGEPGELVYTNLFMDTQPLLRYRSRDIGRLHPDPVCACGSSWPRIAQGIEGRADDMIWYKGVNIYPSAVERVVRGLPELADEFQIVLRGTWERPELVVRVEPLQDKVAYDRLVPLVEEKLRAALGVTTKVELCTPGTLPRSDYKARRVLDQRIGESGGL